MDVLAYDLKCKTCGEIMEKRTNLLDMGIVYYCSCNFFSIPSKWIRENKGDELTALLKREKAKIVPREEKKMT